MRGKVLPHASTLLFQRGNVEMGVSLFKRTKPVTTPVPGAVYQRMIFNSVETAQVVDVTEEGFPLPHVRYIARNDMMDGPDRGHPARNIRILSVDSFNRLFGHPRAG
jgi:hypothetical protein